MVSKVGQQQGTVVGVGDLDSKRPFKVRARGIIIAGDCVSSGQRLVRKGEIPVDDAVLRAQVEDAAGVMQARFGPAQHGIHARALPLPAREVSRCTGHTPVMTRRVCHVQHPVVVIAAAVFLLH